MKKFYTFLVSLLIAQYSFAQWPANYDGVMLQAFYWDSFDDTKWTNLTSQVDELSTYFNLLWVPNSSNCVSNNSMGYMPVYWLDHRSSFGGRERYLTEMIAAYKAKNVGIIGDVVINHKSPVGKNGSHIDFANESRKGIVNTDVTYTLNWTPADICSNDDGGYTKSLFPEVSGANETTEDFSGARDLDHSGSNVQQNCMTYLDFLIKELGYVGFRLDMVKGYAPEYTKMYNEHAKPKFCVGERWSGYDDITWWINNTGKTSAAFDFPLKFQIKEAFNDGNWDKLKETSLASNNDYKRYSVTFVDNHDTYRDENSERLRKNILAANAYMLAMPGTPCVFLKHWKRYPIAIGNMILARKAAGVNNQSSIKQLETVSGGGVILKTEGTKGTLIVHCGAAASYATPSGFKLICEGEGFKFYVSNNITVSGLREGEDSNGEDAADNASVYVQCTAAPNLYAWTTSGTPLLGSWPGSEMTETEVIKGNTFYKYTFASAPVNIIFNNGQGVQTADISIAHDSYFTFDPTNTDKNKNYTDITSEYYTPGEVTIPACAKPLANTIYAYFRGNLDYDDVYTWVWGAEDKNFCKNSSWPGDKLKIVGKDEKGRDVWLWDGGKLGAEMPTNILFSNCGHPQTADFTFQNGGYYTIYGLQGTTTGVEQVKTTPVTTTNNATYNLNGQRVSDSYRGIVIKNGRKYINK